jgi:hypothetical protein
MSHATMPLQKQPLPLHDKCEFEHTMIEYLGLVISLGTIAMDPMKVAGVADWPIPKSKKEVQSFLGFTNFYRRFIEGFSHFARPLFDLTKKDVAWNWGPKQQAAFDEVNTQITSSPVLALADDSLQYCIEADSSDVATGVVLSPQSKLDDKWHPIAFYSKSLSAVERNYDIHDKEMLGSCGHSRSGDIFWKVRTTGSRSGWITKIFNTSCRQRNSIIGRPNRWSLYLSCFDFMMHHRPGTSMGKCDTLLQRADHGSGSDDNRDITLLHHKFFTVRALEGVTFKGPKCDIT